MRTRSPTQLLQACRRGDERAARLLHALAAPAMLACARAILRDPAAAEDATQQAFCRVMEVPRRDIDRVLDAVPWLTALARRDALMMLRSARRRRLREQQWTALANNPTAPRDHAELEDAIERLPRPLREVLVLRHVAELTFDQIAVAVNANRNTVASRYRLALERLRRRLAPELERSTALSEEASCPTA